MIPEKYKGFVPEQYDKRILVTGGAGFIGNAVIKHLILKYPSYFIVNYDLLTYAGNLANLGNFENDPNYGFIRGDITDIALLAEVFDFFGITDVIHLAAESHVDRSINGPADFVRTNINGTFILLEVARAAWKDDYSAHRFHHVSTDEVFGSLPLRGISKFDENTKYDPHSPYSASKAASDHLVKAYHDTYGLNITISNCSNNYGPYQFPEKLIPLVINNLVNNRPIPVYGKGDNVRDWIFVGDHAAAIDVIFHKGKSGETYCVGGNHEMSNLAIVKTIINVYNKLTHSSVKPEKVIEFVEDRKGHDKRYAINTKKITDELRWRPLETFSSGIEKTVKWYLENGEWLENVTSGEYRNYYKEHYGKEIDEKRD